MRAALAAIQTHMKLRELIYQAVIAGDDATMNELTGRSSEAYEAKVQAVHAYKTHLLTHEGETLRYRVNGA